MFEVKRDDKEIRLTFWGECKASISIDTITNQVANRFTFWLTPDEADRIAFHLNSELQDMEREK